jgi:hypothetical protein
MPPTKRWSSADLDAMIERVTPDVLALLADGAKPVAPDYHRLVSLLDGLTPILERHAFPRLLRPRRHRARGGCDDVVVDVGAGHQRQPLEGLPLGGFVHRGQGLGFLS